MRGVRTKLAYIAAGVVALVVFVVGTDKALESLMLDSGPYVRVDGWTAVELVGRQLGVAITAAAVTAVVFVFARGPDEG